MRLWQTLPELFEHPLLQSELLRSEYHKMLKTIKVSFFIVLASVGIAPAFASDSLSERIEFSGFARVIGGYLDDDRASYDAYSSSLDFSQQSLFALQSEFTFTDKLSVSGQLLAHSSDERESGLEWLYINYEPTQNWRFKLGKIRTPFFRYSDIIDVGFTYPWITPPQQVYSGFLFSNYEGLTATYRLSIDSVNLEFEAYKGSYEGEFSRAGEEVDISVDEIQGLIFTLNRGNLNARATIFESSDFFADVPEFTQFANALENAGFRENAESLRFNGKVRGYQTSINYDTLDYFVSAEWVKIASDLLVVPQLESYYVSAGYNFHPFQIHITYASSNSSYDTAQNLIPKGVDPQLDQLSFVYDQVTGNLPLYNLNSVTLGARWDFRHNMAAKAEVTFLDGKPGENSYFSEIIDSDFDRKAALYQFGVEWIF